MKRTLSAFFLALAACVSPRPILVAPPASQGYFTGADSVRLFYRAFGQGQDTVIAVHGFQGFGTSYMVPDLLPLARNRVLIFFDQRGDGSSSAVRNTARLGLEGRVRDLEALRRHFGLERLALLGHSGGAAVALRYAVEHPGRAERLVLVSPPPPTGTASRKVAIDCPSSGFFTRAEEIFLRCEVPIHCPHYWSTPYIIYPVLCRDTMSGAYTPCECDNSRHRRIRDDAVWKSRLADPGTGGAVNGPMLPR